MLRTLKKNYLLHLSALSARHIRRNEKGYHRDEVYNFLHALTQTAHHHTLTTFHGWPWGDLVQRLPGRARPRKRLRDGVVALCGDDSGGLTDDVFGQRRTGRDSRLGCTRPWLDRQSDAIHCDRLSLCVLFCCLQGCICTLQNNHRGRRRWVSIGLHARSLIFGRLHWRGDSDGHVDYQWRAVLRTVVDGSSGYGAGKCGNAGTGRPRELDACPRVHR